MMRLLLKDLTSLPDFTMSEAQLQKTVLAYLQSQGAWTVKVVAANKNGVPDILGCYKGKFFAIELKAPSVKEQGSALQEHQIALIKSSGGSAVVCNNLDHVKTFLTTI